MTKRIPIVTAIVAAAVLAVGAGLAIGLPARAEDNPTPSVSGSSTEDGTDDGETADDQGTEDGSDDGESADDEGVEDGTDDGETNDD
jgi:hypothetical protein